MKNKSPHVEMTLFQQGVIKGGIEYPSINNYYWASRLAAMLIWWNQEDRDVWAIEQYRVLVPLNEWALMNPALRL